MEVGLSTYILQIPCFIETSAFNANGLDLDRTPRSEESDVGPHCLLMYLLGDARHKWVQGAMAKKAVITYRNRLGSGESAHPQSHPNR